MNQKILQIGVLGIQGSVIEHLESLEKLKQSSDATISKDFEILTVKTSKEIKKLDGLIIPGGESTTIGKLLHRFGLSKTIKEQFQKGKLAIWGTCAGAILLAKEICNKNENEEISSQNKVENLGLMDIKIARNAYGNQLDSFETEIKFNFSKNLDKKISQTQSAEKLITGDGIAKVPAVFIRAPKILEILDFSKTTNSKKTLQILATYNKEIIAVRQGKLLATTFHPEMTDSTKIHQYFLEICEAKN